MWETFTDPNQYDTLNTAHIYRPKSIRYPQCLPHLQTQINMIPSMPPTFTDPNQYDTLNASHIYRPKSIRYPQCLPHLQTSFSRTCWAEVSNISLCIYI